MANESKLDATPCPVCGEKLFEHFRESDLQRCLARAASPKVVDAARQVVASVTKLRDLHCTDLDGVFAYEKAMGDVELLAKAVGR